ncbi:RagB/SusD family nutrient uptake outer membrane protein [Chitinophagaceae bacterium LB-8]|uniref:RagB/SusD family nutrient uptake outer membrane protein n=1 Tax=Paraflavisolibacter caeni TaxID=2982496 RepID=A0A9X3BHN3_9BACT|nr:RagB/SusD family nutrient uptake outer membrane protein [Paraflavisolibacter caeni]MCU7552624.1 RagB/SusD family nutrient uptake outer membrane protein [Paraflavisolibacter caeni]
MKLNKYKIAIGGIIGFSCMALTSCNKYLDKAQPGGSVAATAFVTANDFNMAVLNEYASLRGTYSADFTCHNLDKHSDDQSPIMGTFQEQADYNRFMVNTATTSLDQYWNGFYGAINQANTVLDQIDGANIDATLKNYYKGEALFIRGYSYFQLGWLYGGVPLYSHVNTTDEVKTTKRSTQAETFAFAAADLSNAKTLLPAAWSSNNLGRATKYAAEGILARLYLFQKNYAAMKPLLEDIITSNKYTPFVNFKDAFLETFNNQKENIFQLQHATGNGQGNNIAYTYIPPALDNTKNSPYQDAYTDSSQALLVYGRSTGGYDFRFSNDLWNSFEAGDRRRGISLRKGYTLVGGAKDYNTIYLVKYNWGAKPTSAGDYPNNKTLLRLTDVYLMYAECLNETGGPTTIGVTDATLGALSPASILTWVRTRAGLTTTAPASQAACRTAIFMERRHEFVGEFLRWFDIARQGSAQAMSIINTFLVNETGQTMSQLQSTWGANVGMQDFELLFPIRPYELAQVGNTNYLWQNPGY